MSTAPLKSERLFTPIKQPHFFEGQLLSSGELNRLSQFVIDREQLLLGITYGKGGILHQIGDEFRIEIIDSEQFVIKIHAGAAMTDKGYLLLLTQPLELNISKSFQDMRRMLYAYIAPDISLSDHMVDPEVDSIEGFASKHLGNQIQLSDQPRSQDDAVELFRIELDASIKFVTLNEERESASRLPLGAIDLRHRHYLPRLASLTMSPYQRLYYQQKLNQLQTTLDKIHQLFNLPKNNQLAFDLLAIDLEISRASIDPLAIRHLIRDLTRQIAQVLDTLRQTIGTVDPDQDERPSVIESLLTELSSIETAEQLSHDLIQTFIDIGPKMDEQILGGTHKKELFLKIQDALKATRHEPFSATSRIAPAGVLLRRQDQVCNNNLENRVTCNSGSKELISLQVNYGNGDKGELQALTVQGGVIRVVTDQLQSGRDLLVISQTYKRRQNLSVRYSFNDAVVHEEKTSNQDDENAVTTFGFLVSGDSIAPNQNCLEITIEDFELNYPFMGVWFYQ